MRNRGYEPGAWSVAVTQSATAPPPIVAWLGYGGLLPFMGLTAAAVFSGTKHPWLVRALFDYAAVILSFIGALHWGFAMSLPQLDPRQQRGMYAWSVVPSLLAWVLLLLPPLAAAIGFIIGFVAQLLRDLNLARKAALPGWYLPLRRRLTVVVSLCIFVLLALVGCSPGGHSVTLSWTAPTQHIDGSPMRDLAGYYVYFGTDAKRYSGAVQLHGATVNHYVVENLPPGKYYFSIAAYTVTGVQSGLSPPVMKQIP